MKKRERTRNCAAAYSVNEAIIGCLYKGGETYAFLLFEPFALPARLVGRLLPQKLPQMPQLPKVLPRLGSLQVLLGHGLRRKMLVSFLLLINRPPMSPAYAPGTIPDAGRRRLAEARCFASIPRQPVSARPVQTFRRIPRTRRAPPRRAPTARGGRRR